MARTFGPIQGAGVSVTERDAEQPITASALGWVGYAGIMERGPTDELIICVSKTDMIARTGNLIPDSTLPDVMRDYFDLAAGAGGLLGVRVTDGNELQATTTLYARRSDIQTPIGTLKSKDGGRWGGFSDKATSQVVDEVADITETTVDTGILTWTTDQWVGAYVELAGVTNTRYVVVGNDNLGVLTVSADAEMATDLLGGGDPTNDRWYLTLEGRTDRGLEYEIADGEIDPDNEFSLRIFLDGLDVTPGGWGSLSMDPDEATYWVDVINNSDANLYVVAEDTWTGAVVPNVRPANIYQNWSGLTATVLTAEIADFSISSVGGGDPTFALGATSDEHVAQTITITMTAATTGTLMSDKFGALPGIITLGAEYAPADGVKWVPPFTVTAGGTPLAIADTLTIQYKPLGAVDSLVGGTLIPDKVDNPTNVYRIVSNDHGSITVSVGSDMATDVSGGDTEFMVISPERMDQGRDGVADLDDNDYIQAFDIALSLFLRIKGRNLGLVKFACPGVTSTNVQKAGAAFVSSGALGAQQWRYEVPSTLTTETGIENHVRNVLGQSPFGDYVVTAQGFADVVDPEAASKLKLVPTVGMIHGREASFARAWQGYHKAASGLEATLPRIVRLNTGDVRLNEEYLNPRGVNVIRKRGADFILWGNRTVTSNTAWRFKHQRETMSYYIDTLNENFDFSIFAVNDPTQWAVIRGSLYGFFRPEYAKRALDNSLPIKSALIIKIDSENNTSATQANGELNAEVTVAIVNSVENLKFGIGKAGAIITGA